MSTKYRIVAALGFSFMLVLAGCESEKPSEKPSEAPPTAESAAPPPTPQTLFDRLGGRDGITSIVEQLLTNIGGDARIRGHFTNLDLSRFKTQMGDFICQLTEGPCRYTGKEIKAAHKPFLITEEDFGAFMEALSKGLDGQQVAQADKDALIGMMDKLKPDVVATFGGGS